jgi:hypothetical protein
MVLWAGQESFFILTDVTKKRSSKHSLYPSLPGSVTNEKRTLKNATANLMITINGASVKIHHPSVTFPACECNWRAPLTLNLL